MDFPKKDITIYHKISEGYERYHLIASVRNISIRNHNKNGTNSSENVIIRVFDVKGYKNKWFISKDDVIVNLKCEDFIQKEAYSELKKIYGRENVFSVKEINELIFEDDDFETLSHIKIGCD